MSMVQLISYNFATVEVTLSDGGNFSANTDQAAFAVAVANQCKSKGSSGADAQMFWSGPGGISADGNWADDQYAEITIGAISAGADYFGPAVRCGALQGYVGLVLIGSSSSNGLYKLSAGAYTQIGTGFSATVAAGDVWRITVVGTTITITQNGTQRGSFTDSSLTTGNPGLFMAPTTVAGSYMSLFAAGANQAATPTFSPVAGTYTGTQTITLTSTSGGTIYYTKDGTTPTHASSSISSGSTISVSASATVKAIASVSDFADSAVGSAAYTITSGGGSSCMGLLRLLGVN